MMGTSYTGGRIMPTVTLEDAQARLADLVAGLKPGEAVVITRGTTPVATLTAASTPLRQPRVPGSAKGTLTIVSDDDEHLADFAEYMDPAGPRQLGFMSGSVLYMAPDFDAPLDDFREYME